jgi:hypothetical protein
VNGLNRLSGGIMLKRFFWAVLCTVILIGKIHAQEVIVAREKKPELPAQTPQPSEPVTTETPTPAPSKSREKKAAPATLTLEEMRAAGARAAEGLNSRTVSQSTKTREPDVESVSVPNPTVAETPRPVKKETPVEQNEQKSSSRQSRSRGTNIEGLGPIRPTMMESGREAPSPSPSGR